MNISIKLLKLNISLLTFLVMSLSLEAEPKKAHIKNILFIVADDLKASVLGTYGDKVCKTPNIDKLAEQSLVFDRAYCQGVVCGPSRTSFMHSRYRGSLGTNLAEHFKNNAWYTARVGKIYHMRVPYDIINGTDGQDIASSWTERFNSSGREAHTPGDYACLNLNIFTDKLEHRESTKMPNRMFVSVSYEGDGSDQPDYKSASKTIELLNKHKDKPFFIATGLVRPHYPNVAPKQYFEPYPWEKIELPEIYKNDLADIPKMGRAKTMNSSNPIGKYIDNQKRMWSAYYATVQFMDEQVGRILDELERLGLRESTAIVFLSDHGYHLGEHGFWQKQNLHEEVTRVPLMIYVPGMKAGRTQALTELVDIYPSLTTLLGIETPKEVQGKSFLPLLEHNNKTIRNEALSLLSSAKGYSIRTDTYTYIRYKDMSEELYNMNKDPKQFKNLSKNPEYRPVLEKLRIQFDLRLKQEGLNKPAKKK
ncbi:sulfatase [Lentisphaera profundi]|uniref:Sulfatase n=1 Tax=Lentisphaera profundi TaxID=1658616 RepID=A0ABY7W060_9BACT|nr:sulfatase [Lentisphaera profundi]WDE99454.1 sulfatase [Lentisphaera profundi]